MARQDPSQVLDFLSYSDSSDDCRDARRDIMDRMSTYNAEWMTDLAKKAGEIPGTSAKEKSERDARYITTGMGQSYQPFGRSDSKLPVIPPLSTKLPALMAQLTAALLSSLSMTSNKKSSVTMLIGLLVRLGAAPAAKTTFLRMRFQVVKILVRKIRFEGHIGAYSGDLAIVTFTAIKYKANWFLASFKESEAASTFIDWRNSK
ncbi:hypothetical protein BDZ89DRAFT_1138562 [Hymenopellis radicata]|nr:hypothetical protein BDZ89DRAFT_1138562 [Hymenopellis radicata]